MVCIQAAGNELTKGGIGSALGCTPSQHAGIPSIMLGFQWKDCMQESHPFFGYAIGPVTCGNLELLARVIKSLIS